MILRVPYYYDAFSCIAHRCKNSCCVGWEIDIDEETFDYYKSVPGVFGERLKQNMAEGEDNSFVLKNGRCPFLNEKNLCDICIELGEESLCEICTEYPRFTIVYGNTIEKCLGISCEEAGRLVFSQDTPFYTVDREIAEAYEMEDALKDGEESVWDAAVKDESPAEWEGCMEDFEDSSEKISDCRKETWEYIKEARDYAICILQNREIALKERIVMYLYFAKEVQEQLNKNEPWNIEQVIADAKTGKKGRMCNFGGSEGTGFSPKRSRMEALRERIEVFETLEILDEEWPKALAHSKEILLSEQMTEADYIGLHQEFFRYYEKRSYEWEQLLVYFTFRYFMKSVYDYRFFSQAQFAVVSFLMIWDMDLVRFLDEGHQYSKADRVDVARIYSKEVEHSEDNLELLAENFDFEEVFSLEELCAQVLL